MGAKFRLEIIAGIKLFVYNCNVPVYERVDMRGRKALLLLIYLYLHGREAVPRDRLLELFWPEHDEGSARDNLSTTLGVVKRTLGKFAPDGEQVISADRDTVTLNHNKFSSDYEDFELLVSRANESANQPERIAFLTEALADGINKPLEGVYTEWAVEFQDSFMEKCSGVAAALLHLNANTGDFAAVCEVADTGIRLQPFDEQFWRAKMRALATLGRHTEAIETYQKLTSLLRSELDTQPCKASMELAQRIRTAPGQFSERAQEITAGSDAPPQPQKQETVQRIEGSVPARLTSFIGRDSERGTLQLLLESPDNRARLITLTGPGGTGKTRLAIEAAHIVGSKFSDGVLYISLADVYSAEAIPPLILHSIGASGTQSEHLYEAINNILGARELLLVLDNFEQLVEEASGFIRSLLDRVPGITILITSRIRLELEGEVEVHVYPLPIPHSQYSLEALSQCSSVKLFTERASVSATRFELTDENCVIVGHLCDRLEGIPLAIELAAAWCSVLTIDQILTGMAQRFELMKSRRRDVSNRHRTLYDTIGWSYRLLPASAQEAFRALSVFHGGFSVERLHDLLNRMPVVAAAADASAANTISTQSIGIVAGLVFEIHAHSLIRAEEAAIGESKQMRYSMLESLREFAWEQCDDGQRALLHQHHAACFQAWIYSMRREMDSASDTRKREILDALELEMDNLRAALQTLLDGSNDPSITAQMALDLDWLWMVRNYAADRRMWSFTVLERLKNSSISEEQLDYLTINAGHFLERNIIVELAGARIHSARAQNSHRRLAHLLMQYTGFTDDTEEKIAAATESLELYTELRDDSRASLARAYLAGVHTHIGNYSQSLPLLAKCLQYSRDTGDEWSTAVVLAAHGEIAVVQGRMAEAIGLFTQALAFFERIQYRQRIGGLNCWLAAANAAQGNLTDAAANLEIYIEEFVRDGTLTRVWETVEIAVPALLCLGHDAVAERMMEYEKVLTAAYPHGLQHYLRELTRLDLHQNNLDRAVVRHKEWEASLAASDNPIVQAEWRVLGTVIAYRLGDLESAHRALRMAMPRIAREHLYMLLLACLPAVGAIANSIGRHEDAVLLLGAFTGLHTARGLVQTTIDQTNFKLACEKVQRELPSESYHRCLHSGSRLGFEEACQLVNRTLANYVQNQDV